MFASSVALNALPGLAKHGARRASLKRYPTAVTQREINAMQALDGRHLVLGEPGFSNALAAETEALPEPAEAAAEVAVAEEPAAEEATEPEAPAAPEASATEASAPEASAPEEAPEPEAPAADEADAPKVDN